MKQYMNALFYHDEAQKVLAERTRAAAAAKAGIAVEAVQTAILPAGTFTYAEAYHQKYALTSHRELRAFLTETYATGKALADSAVATRLNAWLGSGFDRDLSDLRKEIPSYGLPETLQAYVLRKLGAN
jgi:hypothetical protein